jgi:ADP-ribosyl-[dinitrogen reductase] hydrolase
MTSGYIVDTVQTVFDAFFTTDSFEDCLIKVVNRGGDADTTGALAGQLAGAHYGVDAIPERWLKKLSPDVHTAIREQTVHLLALRPESPAEKPKYKAAPVHLLPCPATASAI